MVYMYPKVKWSEQSEAARNEKKYEINCCAGRQHSFGRRVKKELILVVVAWP